MIDDLTVENRRLKKRLRMYEAAHSTHLEKDMLFEVKIHGLPAKKKRELEETLRSFAASIDISSDPSANFLPRDTNHHTSSKNTSLSSSVSRPIDSAYASMSKSGPSPTFVLNRIVADRELQNQHSNEEQKIQTFLHNIPEGLPPKHSMVMTERQKKKIVVRRLEQLFTGQRGYTVGDHSQPLQQQQVSESAAMADRAASFTRSSAEGVREAQILPYEMEVDSERPVTLADDSSHETNDSRGCSDSAAGSSPDLSHEQRPTRPLDLDPDRAQIPSENVEYLLHLNLSAPSFESGISADVGTNGDGWMYLNLLINMAQLHIFNVTPDFVRSAVADVSEKFQLSRDGRKVRWRGGTDGTRFSSDSGASSTSGSHMDSDSLDETYRKRRKIHVGTFASARVDISDRKSSKSAQHNPLHYEPLFHHRKLSSEDLMSCGESESPYAFGRGPADESGTGRVSRVPHLRSRGTRSPSGGRARRWTDGPIVFYSGLQFCTDLSGDREDVTTLLHETTVGKEDYGDSTRDVLGSTSRSGAPKVSRMPSGSSLPFRSFKDYSKGPESLQSNETRSKTTDLLVDEDCGFDFELKWTSRSAPANFLMSFDASGLGGTQPADHFAVRVETRRRIVDNHMKAKSKLSAPGPDSRKFLHKIPKSAFEMFQNSGRASSEDAITSSLATLNASPPAKRSQAEDLSVQTEIVSAQLYRLQPSALPPPLGYYAELSSSDSDTEPITILDFLACEGRSPW